MSMSADERINESLIMFHVEHFQKLLPVFTIKIVRDNR